MLASMSLAVDVGERMLMAHSLQEIFGGNAVSDEYAIGRHVANLFVTQTYEGQSDIHSQYSSIISHKSSLLTACQV